MVIIVERSIYSVAQKEKVLALVPVSMEEPVGLAKAASMLFDEYEGLYEMIKNGKDFAIGDKIVLVKTRNKNNEEHDEDKIIEIIKRFSSIGIKELAMPKISGYGNIKHEKIVKSFENMEDFYLIICTNPIKRIKNNK